MNELRRKRKDLDLTQLQTASACGVSLRTYQTYEETTNLNATYDELIRKLDEISKRGSENHVLSVRSIKFTCRQLFRERYPEIQCAFLYGSYARGEATGKSDIDILLVLRKPMGMRLFSIASDLEEAFNKQVDVQTYEQLIGNPDMLRDLLVEGIKIYG